MEAPTPSSARFRKASRLLMVVVSPMNSSPNCPKNTLRVKKETTMAMKETMKFTFMFSMALETLDSFDMYSDYVV